jgi:hypothetical protein
MDFVFEKLKTGKYDRLCVFRGGRLEEIACPKVGGIPHEMVHFAVESTLARNGFLRRIAKGEPLAFRMAGNAESDQIEWLVSVMQSDRLSGFPPAEELIDMYRVTCEARGVESWPVGENDIADIRAEMARLETLWSKTEAGSSLALRFAELTH